MHPNQPLRQALALQQAARASVALPSTTRFKDGGVAFYGRSGLDSTGAGLLAALVVGLALAAGLLLVYERVSRRLHGRQRATFDPLELVAPRMFQTPTFAARPPSPPTSRLAWIFKPALQVNSFVSQYPSPTDTTPSFLTDSQLAVRGLLLLALIAGLYALPALFIALPLFTINIVSTTRYTSGSAILPGLGANETIFGAFSSLDDLSIVRLLHAQRLKDARVQGAVEGATTSLRLGLLVALGLGIPSFLVAWITRRQLAKAKAHQRAARESRVGGTGCEMVFLPMIGVEMQGMSERRLREVLGACGLGSAGAGNGAAGGAAVAEASRSSISVDEVFAVQDLSTLARLDKERERIIDDLEVAECEYMACFEPSTLPELERDAGRPSMSARGSHESSRTRRAISKHDTKAAAARPKSSISPFAPLGHFTLTPRPPPTASILFLEAAPTPAARRPSHTLSESIGRHVTGAQFIEVGLVDRPDEFELGQKLRINEQGRWSRAPPTPRALETTFGFGDAGAPPSSSDSPPSSPLGEKVASEIGSMRADSGHRSRYIAFPPPRASSLGLVGLATLEEGEEALSEGERSEATTKRCSSSVPDIDDLPSIDSDSDEEHYRTSRLHQATRVDIPTPPGLPAIVIRKPSASSSNRLSLPGWRRKKASPPDLRSPLPASRTHTPLPEDPLLRTPSHTPAPTLGADTLPSPSFRLSFNPSITTNLALPDASAIAAPRYAPRLRTLSTVTSIELANLYTTLRHKRSELKRRNAEIADLQIVASAEVVEGRGRLAGFLLVGRGVGSLRRVEKIGGKTKEDVRWEFLYQGGRKGSEFRFWGQVVGLAVLMCILAIIPSTLTVAGTPAFASVWTFARPLLEHGALVAGLATVVLPVLLLLSIHTIMVLSVDYLSRSASISITRSRCLALQASLGLSAVLIIFVVTFGAMASASANLRPGFHIGRTLADGAVAISPLLLSTSILGALVVPVWSLVRPLETARNIRQLTAAKTPRQRFLALQPTYHSPSVLLAFPLLSLCGVLGLSLLSPLTALPVAPFLLLAALVARHNGLYRSLHSQETCGTYLITLLTAASFLVPLQPLLLGFILLGYRHFGHGAACLALSLLLTVVLTFDHLKLSRSQRLSQESRQAIARFHFSLRHGTTPQTRAGEGASRAASRASLLPTRRSMASIFDMLDARGFSSVSLSRPSQPSLPLPELDLLDTFASAELASRLHPDAPPRLALPSSSAQAGSKDAASRRTMYPPVLVEARPAVWLPRDELSAEQAKELRELYGLEVVWEDSVELRKLGGL